MHDDIILDLRRMGFTILEPAPPPPLPENVCVSCGATESESEWGCLTDVRVIIADGEEGYADLKKYVCEECLEPMQDALCALGFKDHRHGGINYLEDAKCVGALDTGKCPTPDLDED